MSKKVISATVTPLLENGNLDKPGLKNILERNIRHGIDGVFLFWSPVKEHPVGGTIHDIKANILKTSKTLEEWQKVSGMDKNSIHADPMFVDYKNGDFRLKEGSPAKGKGATLP